LLAAAVATLLLMDAAQAQDKLKVRFGVLKTASQSAFYVGAEKGIFAKYGFDVEVKPLTTGVQANQSLAANQVDWSGGGVESTVVAWATNLQFKAYSMYAKGGDSYGILVRNDAHINSPKDLQSKKVAVPQGTAPAQGLSQVMEQNGLAPDSVQRVNATYGSMGQMLIQGAVSAMVGLEPFLTLTEGKMQGQATLLMRLGKYVQGGGFFLINDSWVKAHPDKLEAAVTALWEAQKWVRDNPAAAADIEAKFLAVDPQIVAGTFKWLQYDPLVDEFTATSVRKTTDYLAKEGLISHNIDTAQYLKPLQDIAAAIKAKHGDLLK
jgi:sulfonate transport system substrate-binding protein